MLVSFTGPSGVGKSFTKRALQATFPGMGELVWLTTRPLRAKELQGPTNRRNVPQEHFDQLRDSGGFLVHQTLYGNSYGITHDELSRCSNGGLWVTEFNIETLAHVRPFVPKLVPIALVPESVALLRERIIARDSASADLAERLERAQQEIAMILERSEEFSLIVEVSETKKGRDTETVIAFLQEWSRNHD
jgi:guanylate kinase